MIRTAVVAALISTRLARADSAAPPESPPDPAVEHAGQANLAPIAWRDNIVVTLGIGGSFTIGLGIADAVGRGGSGTLRIAKVATPRWMITLELSTYALLHSFAGQIYTNTEGAFALGAQHYVRPKLWVRFAGGIGAYRGEMVALENGGRGQQQLTGVAAAVGAGLDLKRWGRFVLGIEIDSMTLTTRDGLLLSNGLLLSFAVD